MLLFKNIIFSQNLISNGSFENSTNVDCNGGFYDSTLPNAHTLIDWYIFNSPDYFNSVCSPGGYSVPINIFGINSAKNGNAYIGIIMFNKPGTYQEYVYQHLSSPLISGKIYCLNFYIIRAERKEYAVKQIGAYFSTSIPNLASGYINAIPQIESSSTFLTDTSQWTTIQGCFIANGGEEYITIGNFHSNANTDTLYLGTNNPLPMDPEYAYYYIDDISLIDQTTVGINELGKENGIEVYPNPSNGVFEVKYFNTEKYTIQITNALGQIIQTKELQQGKTSIDVSAEKEGVYFCRVMLNDKVIKTDKIVIIK